MADILMIGGTGTVGSQTVQRLTARGARVRVMTRDPARARVAPRVEAVIGDLDRPATLRAALAGARRLGLITPLSPTEEQGGLAAVEAAQAAGVDRIVFQSLHHVERCPEAPHFAAKIAIERAIRASGVAYTFIRPNSFYQNDLRLREPIGEHGVYPQPLGGVGVNRVDVRDIADGLTAALLDPGHDGETYPVCGPDAHTGEGVAALWSRHLGRPVRYAGDDLEAWSAQARQRMPGWLVDNLVIMYGFLLRHGLLASGADFAQQEKLLGRPPRPFDEFARETAAAWRS